MANRRDRELEGSPHLVLEVGRAPKVLGGQDRLEDTGHVTIGLEEGPDAVTQQLRRRGVVHKLADELGADEGASVWQ